MAHVRDYPLAHTGWRAPDGEYIACPERLTDDGATIDDEGDWILVNSLRADLRAKPSPTTRLQSVRTKLRGEGLQR